MNVVTNIAFISAVAVLTTPLLLANTPIPSDHSTIDNWIEVSDGVISRELTMGHVEYRGEGLNGFTWYVGYLEAEIEAISHRISEGNEGQETQLSLQFQTLENNYDEALHRLELLRIDPDLTNTKDASASFFDGSCQGSVEVDYFSACVASINIFCTQPDELYTSFVVTSDISQAGSQRSSYGTNLTLGGSISRNLSCTADATVMSSHGFATVKKSHTDPPPVNTPPTNGPCEGDYLRQYGAENYRAECP